MKFNVKPSKKDYGWIKQSELETLTLDEVKEKRIEKLKEECSNDIYSGFLAFNGHYYGFNTHDQMNFTQQMTMMFGGVINTEDTIAWKTMDGGVVFHTFEEFNKVLLDAKNHKMVEQEKYWQLEHLILNATTKEEILEIEW